ncbi:hypothetical protein BXZ70DRAFT_57706 [Cristinia sonorae]|uniref:Uncharacterized protein n=1 Tax=Cristinia sonorae TaxID=1940300 RepID=A0A8K0US31_9AGAR|nr:hypothetical protein BXZ70DRAFT_57706 [Cristinia sonorae]
MATTPNSTSPLSQFSFQFYNRPGISWSTRQKTEFIDELRACASRCLDPIPDYQCLSYSPSSLDDKLIAVARLGSSTGPIAAFFSSVILTVPSLETPTTTIPVLHTGLTIAVPEVRSLGLSVILGAHVLLHMLEMQPLGYWFTGLAEVSSNLVNLARYGHNVFPSPNISPSPSDMHLHIARAIASSTQTRAKFSISPEAVFDEASFVFRGANPPGSCFRKNSDDEQWHHRDKRFTSFYRKPLGVNEGNAVLVVGYILPSSILDPIRKESRLHGVTTGTKAKL